MNTLKTEKLKFRNYIKAVLFAVLILFYLSFIFSSSDIVTEDLGRHIKNGEYVFKDFNIFTTNFYADNGIETFPFINHHWLFGVLVYFIYSFGGLDYGFIFLSMFKIIILLSVFSIVFYMALKKSNFYIAFFLSLVFIIILRERNYPRPEIISYLFLLIVILILEKYRNSKDNVFYNNLIYFLPLLNIVWVNIHIYFFLGILFTIFLEIEFVLKKDSFKAKKLMFVILLLILTSLINPNFVTGAVYPLNIFENYEYTLAENQTPYFIHNLYFDPSISVYFFVLFLLFIVKLVNIKKEISDIHNRHFFYIAVFWFAVIASFFAVRNLLLFAIIIMPLLSEEIFYLFNRISKFFKNEQLQKIANNLCYFIFAIIILFFVFNIILNYKYELYKHELKLGINLKNLDSVNFMIANNITGKIFNNYDIGSYIDFSIFPKYRPFVDNRPECYPEGFFKNYKDMQEDDLVWAENLKKYNFSIILFSSNEGTDWGRKFILKRLKDPEWMLVFYDEKLYLLLRKSHFKNLDHLEITKDQIKIDSKKTLSNISSDYTYNEQTILEIYKVILISEYIGDLENQIFGVKKLIELNPYDKYAYNYLGSLYSASENYQNIAQSIVFYKKAIELGYFKASAYNELGYQYFRLKDYESAKKTWESVFYIDPFDKNSKDYLKQLDELRLAGSLN